MFLTAFRGAFRSSSWSASRLIRSLARSSSRDAAAELAFTPSSSAVPRVRCAATSSRSAVDSSRARGDLAEQLVEPGVEHADSPPAGARRRGRRAAQGRTGRRLQPRDDRREEQPREGAPRARGGRPGAAAAQRGEQISLPLGAPARAGHEAPKRRRRRALRRERGRPATGGCRKTRWALPPSSVCERARRCTRSRPRCSPGRAPGPLGRRVRPRAPVLRGKRRPRD